MSTSPPLLKVSCSYITVMHSPVSLIFCHILSMSHFHTLVYSFMPHFVCITMTFSICFMLSAHYILSVLCYYYHFYIHHLLYVLHIFIEVSALPCTAVCMFNCQSVIACLCLTFSLHIYLCRYYSAGVMLHTTYCPCDDMSHLHYIDSVYRSIIMVLWSMTYHGTMPPSSIFTLVQVTLQQ